MNRVDVHYKPSQVRRYFSNSVLRKFEFEVIAAHVASYLAANGDNWTNEPLPFRPFMEAMKTAQMPDSAYMDPLSNPFFAREFVPSMQKFAEDGYITLVPEKRGFTITQKLVEFYAPYAQVA